ncbi:hypothetical protein NDN08_002998 [Rhodosorus marinus]|uniref:Thioredoxin domain-containing protein n=1 Tax=Rhodosorus marinus TaxID=101924 RepID=A0AAV8UVI6_9RHOD|nr:hypothetical protein NDN08_002998 [Rhodosorus marinus]
MFQISGRQLARSRGRIGLLGLRRGLSSGPEGASRGSGTPEARTRWRSPTTWLSLAATSGVASCLLYYYSVQYEERKEAVSGKRSYGTASIGGPFTLVDTSGKSVTDKDYLGKFMLIYFGFTFCPDICPDELEKISEALDLLSEPDQERIVPIMISVDPYRDTPERVKEYLKDFHPRFEGLTGDEDEIEQVAKEYRVYFSKADVTEVGDDYLMDHSIITYLIGPDGNFIEFFGKSTTPKDISVRIKSQIRKHEYDVLGSMMQTNKQATAQ